MPLIIDINALNDRQKYILISSCNLYNDYFDTST